MAIWSLNESPGPLRYAIIGRAVKNESNHAAFIVLGMNLLRGLLFRRH